MNASHHIQQTSILVDLDLPFEPDIHNVFYVENEYNPAINEFIQEHYEDLQQRFLAKDVTFCYLPKLSGHEVPGEVLRYMFPYLPEGSTCVNADFDMEVLKSHIISGAIEGPALIHFIKMPYETGDYLFTYRALEVESEIPLMNQFEMASHSEGYAQFLYLLMGGGFITKDQARETMEFFIAKMKRDIESNPYLSREQKDYEIAMRESCFNALKVSMGL